MSEVKFMKKKTCIMCGNACTGKGKLCCQCKQSQRKKLGKLGEKKLRDNYEEWKEKWR
jgi:hypothetical protein